MSPYRDPPNDIEVARLARAVDEYQESLELRQRWHRNLVTALMIIGILGFYLVPIALAWAFTRVTP